MVEPQQVIFTATDGTPIHGQLFLPPDRFTGERPALIFFHGGSRRHMMLGWHYSSYYHNSYAFNQLMASRGFVVLAVNYRSGIGYGLDFREALDYGATGGAELHDVLGAGLWLRERDDVADDAIGLWGGSYGGYLTAMGLAHASDLFAAGVDIHGVHDWNRTIKNFVPSYNPLEDPERTRLAFESSPLAAVSNWRSPVLLIHGDDDRNVPFAESVTLVEKLRELGVEHELLVFPDEVHSFLTHANWTAAFERASAFLEKHLGARAATPEREPTAVVSTQR
jgi:dipeptidyl aminopeptidase/acylaminoacyl peptidase